MESITIMNNESHIFMAMMRIVKVYDIETIVSLNAQAEGLSGVCVCGRNDGEWKKNTEWPMNE